MNHRDEPPEVWETFGFLVDACRERQALDVQGNSIGQQYPLFLNAPPPSQSQVEAFESYRRASDAWIEQYGKSWKSDAAQRIREIVTVRSQHCSTESLIFLACDLAVAMGVHATDLREMTVAQFLTAWDAFFPGPESGTLSTSNQSQELAGSNQNQSGEKSFPSDEHASDMRLQVESYCDGIEIILNHLDIADRFLKCEGPAIPTMIRAIQSILEQLNHFIQNETGREVAARVSRESQLYIHRCGEFCAESAHRLVEYVAISFIGRDWLGFSPNSDVSHGAVSQVLREFMDSHYGLHDFFHRGLAVVTDGVTVAELRALVDGERYSMLSDSNMKLSPIQLTKAAESIDYLQSVVANSVVRQMTKEAISANVPETRPPGPTADRTFELDSALMPAAEIASLWGISTDALRKRLERWREKNALAKGDWIENTEAGPCDPKYLYRYGAVKHLK